MFLGKEGTKIIEKRRQAAKMPLSFEATGGGHIFNAANTKSMIKLEKPINSNVGAYVLAKRTNSVEDYNTKTTKNSKSILMNFNTDVTGLKGHKRSTQEANAVHNTINRSLSKLKNDVSVSPNGNTRSKYTRDKLKTITTDLGTGASRNSATKGLMTSKVSNKSSKKGKFKSPKYMTQGTGSYYLKGKNSTLST